MDNFLQCSDSKRANFPSLWRLSFSFPTSKKLRQVEYFNNFKSQVDLSQVRKLSGPSVRPTCRPSKLYRGVLSTQPCFRISADSFPGRFDKLTSKYNKNINILRKFAVGNENETGNKSGLHIRWGRTQWLFIRACIIIQRLRHQQGHLGQEHLVIVLPGGLIHSQSLGVSEDIVSNDTRTLYCNHLIQCPRK